MGDAHEIMLVEWPGGIGIEFWLFLSSPVPAVNAGGGKTCVVLAARRAGPMY